MLYAYHPRRPERLTAEIAADEYRALADRIDEAGRSDSPDLWLALFSDWNALLAYMRGEGSRIGYAYARDMTDPNHEEADRYQREIVSPIVSNGESALVTALLASPHRSAIAERHGEQLMRRLHCSVETIAPINNDLRVKAGSIAQRYSKIIASAEVMVQGTPMTLALAGSHLTSPDGRIRREAFVATREWYRRHRDTLAEIFDQLVELRTQMGRNLGHTTHIPLAYQAMGRTDYGPEEAAAFRGNVLRHAVPLLQKLRQQQAERLDVAMLAPWDLEFDPALTLPRDIAPIDEQLDRAERLFEALSPTLAAHFKRMRAEGLIDLENRKGKQAGAFCITFPDEGRAAILCNSTGNADDVRVLIHEMGHAFQKWESAPIEAVMLQNATSDVAEIHSIGLEYLAMRHIGMFFEPEHADRFSQGKWKQALTLLCYAAVVDEFQHAIYERPEMTPDERDAEWNRIWDIYQPGIDWSGVEQYKPLRWYQQMHIFKRPFYYIDYAIAETAAMQLALVDAADHERALDTYIRLCRIGGSLGLLEIFSTAGLRSPFDEELMKDLMNHAEEILIDSPNRKRPHGDL